MKQEIKRKLALELLNRTCCSSLEELPNEAWQLFKHLTHKEIAKPLVIQDREKGLSMGTLAIKYGLTQRQIRYILK